MRPLLCLLVCAVACLGQVRIPGPGGSAASGSTPPDFASVIPAGIVSGTGSPVVFTLPSINVSTTGRDIIIGFGARTSSVCTHIATVTGHGGVDNFTQLVSGAGGSITGGCIWQMKNASVDSSYVIVATSDGSQASAYVVYGGGQFDQRSLAGTVDGLTCANYASGINNVACTTSLTMTGNPELAVAFIATYDDNAAITLTAGSVFTVPTSGVYTSPGGNGSGSAAFAYYIGHPPVGSTTPSFDNTGAGDGGFVTAVAQK